MKRDTSYHPEISETWFDIASAYVVIGNYDSALKAYRNALATNSTSYDAMYGIGQIALIRDDLNLLREIIDKFKCEESEEFRYLVLNGHFYLKIKNIQKAFECFQKAGEFMIMENFFMFGIGLFYEAIGRGTLAGRIFLKHYNRCNLVGYNAELLFRIAMIYKNEGYCAIALRIFNVLMQMHDIRLSWSSIMLQIAHINALEGKFTEARQIIDEVIVTDCDNIFVYRLSAWICYKENNAAKDFDSILKIGLQLDDPYILYIIGRLFFAMNELKDSFRIYKKAIKCDKFEPWFWNSLGVLYAKNNQFEEARLKFVIALSLDKNFSEAEHNLKMLHIQTSTHPSSLSTHSIGMNGDEEINFENMGFIDVDPDLCHSLYFSTHLFLGSSIFRFDKSNTEFYETEIQNIVTKSLE